MESVLHGIRNVGLYEHKQSGLYERRKQSGLYERVGNSQAYMNVGLYEHKQSVPTFSKRAVEYIVS